jgi:ATP-binding cassette, subfamily B, bacterial
VSRLAGSIAVLVVVPRAVFLLALAAIVAYAVLTYKAQNLKWALLRYDSREGRLANYYRGLLTVPHAVLHVRLFGLASTLRDRWRSIIDGQYGIRLKDVRYSRMLNLLISGTTVATYGVGLWITGSAVLAGTASLGVLMLFLTSFNSVSDLIYEISFEIRWLQEERAAFPLLKMLDALPQVVECGLDVPEVKLDIEFRNVTFRYPGGKNNVLRGVSFRIREGEHVGIIGLNGAGKSTILKLLLGFYAPTSGRILVNGRDLAEYNPSSWRRALSMMSQDVFRFEGPVREQVGYGDLDLHDEARLGLASRASCLGKVVESLPRGWQTYAGRFSSMPEDEAIELSGGQAQIVGNARVLYRRARVYVFDEPTSSIDGDKEEVFFGSLPEHVNGSALIYVSHRFSTLRRAPRILVITDGRVSEDGSHDELMALDELYASLFRRQAAHYC